jgi:copper(I)-binding protein
MPIGLKQEVKDGDLVPITLIFEDTSNKRESVDLYVPARALNSMPSKDAAHR